MATDKRDSENDRSEAPSIFRRTLSDGFASLAASKTQLLYPSTPKRPRSPNRKTLRENAPPSTPTREGLEKETDPTSPGSSASPPCWTSAQSSCFIQFIEPEKSSYYPIIDTILHNELQSMIRNVPYTSSRTKRSSLIDCLFLRTISTTSAAFYAQKSLLAGVPISPEEMHLQPYCHVYVARCEGLENYRTKIRPELQQFVKDMEGDNEHYVILYIPTPEKRSGLLGTIGIGGGSGSATRSSSVASSNSSTTSSANASSSAAAPPPVVGGGTSGSTTTTGASNSTPGDASTNKEREMLKKFNTDFPDKCVMLSTLTDALPPTTPRAIRGVKSTSKKTGMIGGINAFTFTSRSTFFQSEWDKFLKHLGLVTVASFQRRCNLYDEDLRRLDSKRTTSEFDFKRYVLVKESLAFSCEQLRLHGEALMQYEEMKAIVPDSGLRNGRHDHGNDDNVTGETGKTNSISESVSNDISQHATSGDTDAFRKTISDPDAVVTALQYHQYFFTRECQLLFLLHRPVEILKKARDFVFLSYMVKLNELGDSTPEADIWALSACWDIKVACEKYFDFSKSTAVCRSNARDEDEDSEHRSTGHLVVQERAASRELSRILEFGRERLLSMGAIAMENFSTSIVRTAMKERPADINKEWISWRDLRLARKPHHADNKVGNRRGRFSSTDCLSFPGNALNSKLTFEAKYIQLTNAIVHVYGHAGRGRLAARMRGEQAEMHILHEEYEEAADILKSIGETCSKDGWHFLYQWRLFRLAFCQRVIGDIPSYFETLIHCFSHRIGMLPTKKLDHLLQNDLECLVSTDEVQHINVGNAPFLESEITVEKVSMGKKSHPLGSLRKKLLISRCHVGEKMSISLKVASHLPRKIGLDSVRLFIVKYDTFERAHKKNVSIGDHNSFRVLSIHGAIAIEPGGNNILFHWIPMTVGQYVLASVEIKWKNVLIVHESMIMRKSIQGFEVLPSDPTQRVELHPLFLIPGEKQEIQLSLFSRDDIITEGTVEFTCSEGLQVHRPEKKEDEVGAWDEKCCVSLNSCGPDNRLIVKTLVRSAAVRSGKYCIQTMRASVSSAYHHRLYKDLTDDEEPEGPPMESTLEAMVTTLDRPALTFNSSEAFSLSKTSVMVSVSVVCNTPTPFFIKEWEVSFPPPLALAEEGDVANDVLIGQPVVVGQELFFCFSCSWIQETDDDGGNAREVEHSDKPTLCIVLSDDKGKSFSQILALDLENFYQKMRAEDEYTGVNTASADLQCSGDEGIVGTPVQFVYMVDLSMITDAKKRFFKGRSSSHATQLSLPPLLYSVECDVQFWVLGGKVRGIVNRKDWADKFSVEFVGIPTHSGLLKVFPEIKVFYASSPQYTSPAITVHCHLPESFMSLSFKHHMALAAPAALDSVASLS